MTVRVDETLKDGAQETLSNRHRELRSFVEACLSAVYKDPDKFLKILEPHWPPPRPRGRPRPPEKGPYATMEQMLDRLKNDHRKALRMIAARGGSVTSSSAYAPEIFGTRARFDTLTRWSVIETVHVRRTKKKAATTGEEVLGNHYETKLTDLGHELVERIGAE